jgi:uncharacterized membrane protein YbhN (UPF0104 family)
MSAKSWGLAVGRVAFLVVGAWFIDRGLQGRGDELRDGLSETPVLGLVVSLLLVSVGLVLTGFFWRAILAALGHRLPVRPALAIFFFGQLGKYIPGSVWSFGAQASGARRHGVPVPATLNASLIFLGFHMATGAVFGFAGALVVASDVGTPLWLNVAGVLAGLVALLPPVVNFASRLTARSGSPLELGLASEAKLLVPMVGAWICYGASIYALRPSLGPSEVVLVAAAYAIAYVAGVLVFLAPAGVGAREATFVLVAGNVLGVGSAAALALLTRIVMTAADVLLAVVASAADGIRGRGAGEGPGGRAWFKRAQDDHLSDTRSP